MSYNIRELTKMKFSEDFKTWKNNKMFEFDVMNKLFFFSLRDLSLMSNFLLVFSMLFFIVLVLTAVELVSTNIGILIFLLGMILDLLMFIISNILTVYYMKARIHVIYMLGKYQIPYLVSKK